MRLARAGKCGVFANKLLCAEALGARAENASQPMPEESVCKVCLRLMGRFQLVFITEFSAGEQRLAKGGEKL